MLPPFYVCTSVDMYACVDSHKNSHVHACTSVCMCKCLDPRTNFLSTILHIHDERTRAHKPEQATQTCTRTQRHNSRLCTLFRRKHSFATFFFFRSIQELFVFTIYVWHVRWIKAASWTSRTWSLASEQYSLYDLIPVASTLMRRVRAGSLSHSSGRRSAAACTMICGLSLSTISLICGVPCNSQSRFPWKWQSSTEKELSRHKVVLVAS
jgi:hypothetical protein